MADQIITIRAAGGDYTSQTAFRAAELPFDVTALGAGSDLYIHIYNDWAAPNGLDEKITWSTSDFITGTSDNQVYIVGMGGTQGSEAPLLTNATSASSQVIRVEHLYVNHSNLRIKNRGTNSSSSAIYSAGGYLDRIDATSDGFGSGSSGIILNDGDTRSAKLTACFSHDVNGDAYTIASFSSAEIYNCGAAEFGGNGFNKQNTSRSNTLTNSWAYNSSGGTGYTNTSALLGSNNASYDATTSGTSPTNNITSAAFVDEPNGDYTPAASGVLDGTGTDLSSELTLDLLGNTYTIPYEIGPYTITSGITPVGFSGNYSNQVGNVSSPFSFDASTSFSGTQTPFTYSLQAGTLPSQLSLNTSTGVISGTPDTIETQVGIVVRATDNDLNTADSNSFEIDIQAALPSTSDANITITGIPDGSYLMNFCHRLTGVQISQHTVSFTGESGSQELGVSAGTEYIYYIVDDVNNVTESDCNDGVTV